MKGQETLERPQGASAYQQETISFYIQTPMSLCNHERGGGFVWITLYKI